MKTVQKHLVICIPTVLCRLKMAQSLHGQLEGYGFQTQLILDSVGNSVLNHNRAWMHGMTFNLSWVAVAQDDIELCPDFGERLQQVWSEFEQGKMGSVLSLYSNYSADVLAFQKGEHFRRHPGRRFLNEQFLVMQAPIVSTYNAYFHSIDLAQYKTGWHDVILAEFFGKYKMNVYHAIPNLVEHQHVKSTLGHGGRNRKSRTFGMVRDG